MTTQSLKSFKLNRSTVLTNWLTIVAITAWGLLMLKYRFTGELALLVRGDLMTETFNGQRELVIQARSLTPIPQPKEPYEYN